MITVDQGAWTFGIGHYRVGHYRGVGHYLATGVLVLD
jgi:hypothetical protein